MLVNSLQKDEMTSSDPSPERAQQKLPASQETFCEMSPQREQPSLTTSPIPSSNLQNTKQEPHHMMLQAQNSENSQLK